MQYRYIVFGFLLFAAVTAGQVVADEDGERFRAGNLDSETAAMLNVPPDDAVDKSTGSAVGDDMTVLASGNVPDEGKDATVITGVDQDSGDMDHDGDAASPDSVSDPPALSGTTDDEQVVKENTLLAYIPEHDYSKDGRQRREMTHDLAVEYPTGEFIPRSIVNNAWGVGEKLTFQITYGFYQAGTATMSVLDTLDINGSQCYHIKTTAHSNKFISSFYKVRDSVESFIDVDGIFSRRFEKRLREGGYKADRIADFYHDRRLALNTRDKYPYTEIPLYVQDILSSLYYLRTFDLEVGKDHEISAYADGKVYPMKVLVHKKEKIEVPAGKFTCFKVEPVLKSEGIFRQKGKLTVWLTDDEYKMPVKMESKIAIGSIATKLESYERVKK